MQIHERMIKLETTYRFSHDILEREALRELDSLISPQLDIYLCLHDLYCQKILE
jgi:hypothetical protein